MSEREEINNIVYRAAVTLTTMRYGRSSFKERQIWNHETFLSTKWVTCPCCKGFAITKERGGTMFKGKVYGYYIAQHKSQNIDETRSSGRINRRDWNFFRSKLGTYVLGKHIVCCMSLNARRLMAQKNCSASEAFEEVEKTSLE